MKTKPFACLWIGEKLGFWEGKSIESFLRQGHRVELFTYGNLGNVPRGATIQDASKVVSTAQINTVKQSLSMAAASDIFRYSLLRSGQYVWFDLDMFALGKIDSAKEYIFGLEGLGRANGALLSYPPDSELAKSLVKKSSALVDSGVSPIAVGPFLLTQEINRLKLWRHAEAPNLFYPTAWREAWKPFSPRHFGAIKRRSRRSVAFHLWNEVIRDTSLNLKSVPVDPDCFLATWSEAAGVQVSVSRPASYLLSPDWSRLVSRLSGKTRLKLFWTSSGRRFAGAPGLLGVWLNKGAFVLRFRARHRILPRRSISS